MADSRPLRLQDIASIKTSEEAPTAISRLLGIGGQERYQTWPERLIREALSAPHDVMAGKIQMPSNLRREDFTDLPPPQSQNSAWFNPTEWQPGDAGIQTANAIANLAMVGSAPFAAKGALGSGGGRLTMPQKYYESIPQDVRLAGSGISHPGYRWEIYDKRNGKVVGDQYTNGHRANGRIDKLNNQYGSYNYVRRMVKADELLPSEKKILKDAGVFDEYVSPLSTNANSLPASSILDNSNLDDLKSGRPVRLENNVLTPIDYNPFESK